MFDAVRARLSRRLRVRSGLDAALWAAVAAACISVAAWALGATRLPYWPLASIVAAVAAVWALLRAPLSPTHAALVLDARAAAEDRLVAALEADGGTLRGPARETVVARGRALLIARGAELARVPVLHPRHAAVLLVLVPIALTPTHVETLRGAGLVAQAQAFAPSADALAFAIEAIPARDEAERARLEEIAERVRRAAAADPTDQETLRRALDELEAMRDGTTAETRAKMAAALPKDASQPLADALRRGDAAAFDAEVERAAAADEAEAREAARTTLGHLEEIARAHGEKRWEDFFRDEQRRLAEAMKKADALRDVAKALKEMGKLPQKAEGEPPFEPTDPRAARRALEEMEKAIAGMTAEERARLAERLASAAEGAGAEGEATREFAERLGAGDQAKDLGEALRELARAPAPSEEAEGERQRGAARDALRGAMGLPMLADGPPEGGGDGDGDGSKSPGDARAVADGAVLPSRAKPELGGAPTGRRTDKRAAAETGAVARVPGGDAAAAAAPRVLGVTDTEIPARYRAQVERYFGR